MALVDAARAVVVGLLAVLVAVDAVTVWMLWFFVFAIGLGQPFFDGAAVSLMRASVPDEALGTANRVLFSSTDVAMEFVSKPLGVGLLSVAAWLPFGFDAASFAFAAAMVFSVRSQPLVEPRALNVRMVWTDMVTGLRWLFAQRFYRVMALLTALANLSQGATFSLFVLYLQDRFDLSDGAIGWVFSAWVLGSIGGGALAARWCRLVNPVRVTLVGLIVEGLGAIVMVAFDALAVFVVVNILIALFGSMWGICIYSFRQLDTPPELLGRALNSFRWVIFTGQVIGGVAGGVLARAFGLRAPFFIVGSVVLLATAVFWRSIDEPRFRAFRVS
jgi:predicted MFS family arabinose efflux permease